jgi:Glycosyltransferase
MKIALIGPGHPLRGGLSTFNERFATKLQEHGHDVTIYSFSLQYPSILFPGKTQLTDEPAPAHLRIRSIINSVNPLNWIKAGNTIRKEKPDLVIVRYWMPFIGASLGTILRIIRANKHSHILCIADNIIPHEKRPGDTALTRYFLRPVDSFITMSKEVLKDLRSFTDKPASFTPHPLYDNFGKAVSKAEACKKLGLEPDKNYLLFFGFIRKYKGLDLLLEAMNEPGIKEKGIHLIIAGEFYESSTPYEEIIAKHQLQDVVHQFTSFIPNGEVQYYFSAADLIVQPYRNATQSGITQVAYHFEKPMVVTNVGGLAEVVPDGKTGFVTTPEPSEIAKTILRFFEPNSIPALQENLATEKKKYSWDSFIETLLATSGLK